MADNLRMMPFPPPIKGMAPAKPAINLDQYEARSIINYVPKEGYLENRPGLAYIANAAISTGTIGAIHMLSNTKGIVGVYDSSTTMDIYSLSTTTGLVSLDPNVAAGSVGYPLVATIWKGNIIYGLYQTAKRWTGTGTPSAITVTGTPTLTSVGVYRNRLYWGCSASTYYSDPDSYGGTYKKFDFAPWLKHYDSYIHFVGPLNGTTGVGNQTLFGAANSYGEFLVYQGEYPGHASWSLIGKYQLPMTIHGYEDSYPVVYMDSTPHWVCDEGVFNLARLQETGSLDQANIAKPVVNQLRTGLNYLRQPSWSIANNLCYIPCQVNLQGAPRANAHALLVYNNATGAWATFIIADNSTQFGNMRLWVSCDPDRGIPFVLSKDGSNNANVGYFTALNTYAQDHSAQNPEYFVAHGFTAGEQKDQYKTAQVWRPLLNLTASSVSGTYAVGTDTQTEAPGWTAGISYDNTTFKNDRNYPTNTTGYMFAPRLTLSATGATSLQYLGSFLEYSTGGKL